MELHKGLNNNAPLLTKVFEATPLSEETLIDTPLNGIQPAHITDGELSMSKTGLLSRLGLVKCMWDHKDHAARIIGYHFQ